MTKQTPNPNAPMNETANGPFGSLNFGAWDLFGHWCLVIDPSDFEFGTIS
jgi:hypothetical protein